MFCEMMHCELLLCILSVCWDEDDNRNAVHSIAGLVGASGPDLWDFGSKGDDVAACRQACEDQDGCMAYT